MNVLRRWWERRKVRAVDRDHARWFASAVALIGETNPDEARRLFELGIAIMDNGDGDIRDRELAVIAETIKVLRAEADRTGVAWTA